MSDVTVGKLIFRFDDGWLVTQYDEWTFYKNKFQLMCNGGVKGVDILAISPDKTAWLIEVKDYREHPRTKVVDLPDEIAQKAFDTLAGLLPAKVGSDDSIEVKFAGSMLGSAKLRIAFHLEQPDKHSALFPRAFNPIVVQQKLRSLVKPVDAHAIVCESNTCSKVPWEVLRAKKNLIVL